MAQPKRKKRRRSRHDPRRKEAARRREEARQQAAEERRRQQAAEQRRKNLKKRMRRLALPALGTVAVFVVALYLFRPPPELDGVQRFTGTDPVMSGLGYEGEWSSQDIELIPAPQCGLTEEAPPGTEVYSALYNGLITLWYQPGSGIGANDIWDAVSAVEDHNLLVAPNTAITTPVAAASWSRLAEYDNTDDLAEYVETYLKHSSPGKETCLGAYAEVNSTLATLGYEDDWANIEPDAEPVCGHLDSTITGAQAHSALYNGAVILWYQAGDQNIVDSLDEITSSYESQVLIAPSDAIDTPVLATAWDRVMAFEKTDRVAEFVDAFRDRGPGDAQCPTNFAEQGS